MNRLALRPLCFLSQAIIIAFFSATAPAQNGSVAETAPSNSASAALDEIVITGSRLKTSSFDTPQPVTTATVDQLTQAQPLIGDALGQLPDFRQSQGPQQQTNGLGFARNFLNLRNLGVTRTLVLIDGQRVLPEDNTNSVDVSLIPSALIERVETVTGGASAAYGSDAVAGVVNFILDKKFTGVKTNIEYGISGDADDHSYQGSLVLGDSFAGGRGHVLVSLESYHSAGLLFSDRAYTRSGTFAIPLVPARTVNGTAVLINTGNVNLVSVAPGGLITSGPLKGLGFGVGGTPYQFGYGSNVGGAYQIGGTGGALGLVTGSLGQTLSLNAPLDRSVGFGRVSFDLTDKVTIYAETTFAHIKSDYQDGYNYLTGSLSPVIQASNPFLPSSVATQMVADGLTKIKLGDQLTDSIFDIDSTTKLADVHVGLDYDIGAGWKAAAYAEYGSTNATIGLPGILNVINFTQATNATRNASGTIVCTSALANPTNGCVPYNPMGIGVNSAAAKAYVFGNEQAWTHTSQEVISANLTGEPFKFWGSPIALAAGVEWRKNEYSQNSDAVSQTFNPTTGVIGGYRAGNYQPVAGDESVKEAYIEAGIPIAKDTRFAKELNLDAAARATDYSISGSVQTWKAGLVYQPPEFAYLDDFRLRATRSRDIRAPNLGDLFASSNPGASNISDPFHNGAVTTGVRQFSYGNPNLVPEIAYTTTYGVVYEPQALRSLKMSLDRYDINIHGAIASLTQQQEINQCYAGSTALCNLVVRDAAGNLLAINTIPFNLSQYILKGFDFAAEYTIPLARSTLSVRALANYVGDYELNPAGVAPINRAGDIGQDHEPRILGNLQFVYEWDPITTFVQTRFIGPGHYDNTLQEGVTINNNHVASAFYVDTRLSYAVPTVSGDLSVYVGVQNLFDKQPVEVGNIVNGSSPLYTDNQLYDLIGRYFRIGLNFKYK